MGYRYKIGQVLLAFLLVVETVIPHAFVFAQEGEVLITEPEVALPVQEVPEVVSVDGGSSVTEGALPPIGVIDPSSPTEGRMLPLVLEENVQNLFTNERAIGKKDALEFPVAESANVVDSRIDRTRASSTSNVDLPFTLTSEKMNFAINEIPSFIFSYRVDEQATGTILSSFIETVVGTVGEAIADAYQGSVVETVVDVVTETFLDVVDFLIPTAEGQELPLSVVSEPESKPEPEPELVISSENSDVEAISIEPSAAVEQPQEVVSDTQEVTDVEIPAETLPLVTADPSEKSSDVVLDDPIEAVSIALSPVVTEEDGVEIIAVTNPTVLTSFALIDGTITPIEFVDDGVGVLQVTPTQGVFDVGEHALELHIIFKGQEYVAYHIFTVDGTVISLKPLTQTSFATVVADSSGFQTLWLQEMASGTVRSFEKITDETVMIKNPILEFKAGVLFLTTAQNDAVMGFDVISKSLFSQTLNTNSRQDNIIELQTGEYEVSVDTSALLIDFVPEVLRI